MKFIVNEPVLTTITNEDVIGEEDIKNVLEQFYNSGEVVSLVIEDSENSGFTRQVDNARIINISENSADIQGYYGSASVKIKDIPYFNFLKLKVLSNKQNISSKYKITKWHKLDIAEIE